MVSNPTSITITAKFTPRTREEQENLIAYLKSAPAVFTEYWWEQDYTSEEHSDYLVEKSYHSKNTDLRFFHVINKREDSAKEDEYDF